MKKLIPGFNRYRIDDIGRVFNKDGKRLRPYLHKSAAKNYLRIGLYNDKGRRKQVRVHRLVAKAFIPNPAKRPEVNHIDHHTLNNRVTNLEWVTCKQNCQHKKLRRRPKNVQA